MLDHFDEMQPEEIEEIEEKREERERGRGGERNSTYARLLLTEATDLQHPCPPPPPIDTRGVYALALA